MTPELLREFARSPEAFRRNLVIDADGGAEQFDPDRWQEQDFETLDSGWLAVAGQSVESPTLRAYLERPRGHSKTLDLAIMVTWALAFSRRMVAGVAAAADKDQARLLRDAVCKIISLNPWLAKRLQVQQWRIANVRTGSTLEILSSDADTSYGLTPDFVIIDELTHWQSRDLWDSLASSAAKRSACMLVVIANAGRGMGTSWHWDVREACRQSPTFYFHRLDGPSASWIIASGALTEQKVLLPAKSFARLWLNEWQTDLGDVLSSADIEACTTLTGPTTGAGAAPMPYMGALDLGLTHDHSAFVIVGLDLEAQKLRLASCQSWKPPPGGKVRLADVKAAVLDAWRRFGLLSVDFDQWQAWDMAQDLANEGVPMYPWQNTPQNLDLAATTLLNVFNNRLIDLYPDAMLTRDLVRLQIVERSKGFKLNAVRDEYGHCDRAIALSMLLPSAMSTMRDLVQTGVRRNAEGAAQFAPPTAIPPYDRSQPQYWRFGPAPSGYVHLEDRAGGFSVGRANV